MLFSSQSLRANIPCPTAATYHRPAGHQHPQYVLAALARMAEA